MHALLQFVSRHAALGRTGALVTIAAAFLIAAPWAGATVILPPGNITVPNSGTFLYLNSQPGDFIGGGQEQLFTPADSSFSASLQPGGSLFSASLFPSAGGFWFVDIAAPSGQPLVAGSYTGATRWPFNQPGEPGLSISGDGNGCNTLTGQFDVNDVQFAPTGELLVFDATFEQHCEGGTAALFGRIRIENQPPPPDTTPPVLNLPSDISVEAPDSSGTNVSYFVSATDGRDPNPIVSCSPASGSFFPVGDTTVNCTATDASGNVSSGSFTVHVLPLLQMGIALDATGTVSAKTGSAKISGTVSCSRAITVNVTGTLKELFANRVQISGSFSTSVNCSAPSANWSASVSGSNGRFGAGRASVSVDAFGCEISCHSDHADTSIKLMATK